MRGRIVVQLVLAFVAAGCGAAASRQYTSPEGRYRVQFPGKPKITDQTVPTHVGPIINKVASTKDWSGTERMVMYADFPFGLIHTANKDRMLDGACQGLATESNLVILSKTPIAMNGHPGREMNFETQEGHQAGKMTGRARIYLIGARMYQVFIAGPTGRITPETMEDFLGSFELLDQGPGPGGPGPGVPPGPGIPPGPPPPQNVGRPPVEPPNPSLVPQPPGGSTAAPPGTLSFYNIPEPASAPIEADGWGMGSTPGEAEVPGLGGSPRPRAAAAGAAIRSFDWVDADADYVGGVGDAAGPDGTKDQHLKLDINLPPNAIVESLTISSGPGNRWVTQPGGQWWPIAIYQNGRPVSRSFVTQVGAFSGPQVFDLYINTGGGPAPGRPIDLELTLSIGGRRVSLGSQCKRPEQAASALADARPARAEGGTAPTPAIAADPVAPAPAGMAADPGTGPEVAPAVQPTTTAAAPPSERRPSAVPVLVKPSSGGATIVSFDWLDQKDDRVGTAGRRIAAGGGKDEHFQLAIDLPAAAIIEEVAVTGGGPVRWTTKPTPRTWPLAVVANNELKNRAQVYRLGAFSGRWTFDLYAEAQEGVQPDQAYVAEVVVFLRGTRHTLTSRCQRK